MLVAALPALTAHAKRPADPTARVSGVAAGPGEVAEWSIAPHSKCGVRASVPGVRIPPSPPPTKLLIWLYDLSLGGGIAGHAFRSAAARVGRRSLRAAGSERGQPALAPSYSLESDFRTPVGGFRIRRTRRRASPRRHGSCVRSPPYHAR